MKPALHNFSTPPPGVWTLPRTRVPRPGCEPFEAVLQVDTGSVRKLTSFAWLETLTAVDGAHAWEYLRRLANLSPGNLLDDLAPGHPWLRACFESKKVAAEKSLQQKCVVMLEEMRRLRQAMGKELQDAEAGVLTLEKELGGFTPGSGPKMGGTEAAKRLLALTGRRSAATQVVDHRNALRAELAGLKKRIAMRPTPPPIEPFVEAEREAYHNVQELAAATPSENYPPEVHLEALGQAREVLVECRRQLEHLRTDHEPIEYAKKLERALEEPEPDIAAIDAEIRETQELCTGAREYEARMRMWEALNRARHRREAALETNEVQWARMRIIQEDLDAWLPAHLVRSGVTIKVSNLEVELPEERWLWSVDIHSCYVRAVPMRAKTFLALGVDLQERIQDRAAERKLAVLLY